MRRQAAVVEESDLEALLVSGALAPEASPEALDEAVSPLLSVFELDEPLADAFPLRL